MLRLRNIQKSFGSRMLLNRFDLDVHEEERFFILGPSGCGKTTLLRIIAGLDRKHEGTVEIRNCNMAGIPPHKRGVGFVFQDGALWPHLTVEKHLTYAPGSRARKEWHDYLLVLTELSSRKKDYPTTLSGGERQRLALARALSLKPNLLLLDEPLRNLDRNLALELREAMVHILKKTETTAVFVTHDQEEALSMAQRVLLMGKNGPVQIGAPEEIYNQPATWWAASFFGPANRFEGISGPEGTVPTPLGPMATPFPPGTSCKLVLKASQIEVGLEEKGIPARVKRQIFRGDNFYLQCDVEGHDLTAWSRSRLPNTATTVFLSITSEPAVFRNSEPSTGVEPL